MQALSSASVCMIGSVNVPSKEQWRIGIDRTDGGPHHHAVPVRERTLGDVRENQLANLVREAAETLADGNRNGLKDIPCAPVQDEGKHPRRVYDFDGSGEPCYLKGDMYEEGNEAEKRREKREVLLSFGGDDVCVSGVVLAR